MDAFKKNSEFVRCTPEIVRYTHDIVSFMRLQRGVRGGISALSARHLVKLSKYVFISMTERNVLTSTRVLAVLHSLYYVTPALVAVACRLVFTHRITLASAETERSVLWGSNLGAVECALHDTSINSILADTLAHVACPL